MPKRRVFIGSSKEAEGHAREIALALEHDGFDPVAWWHPQTFPPGSYVPDRLRELARQVDGAVFLFTSEDKAWKRGLYIDIARDNVAIEAGIFVGALGRDRTVLAVEDGVTMATDWNGMTHLTLDRHVATQKVVDHFKHVFRSSELPPLETVLVASDPRILRLAIDDNIPVEFGHRSLYLGSGGARHWLKACNDPEYLPEAIKRKLRQLHCRAVKDLDIATFISFGPGDAKYDRWIAQQLLLTDPVVRYIPIDINYLLLQTAIHEVGEFLRIPVAIHADFEHSFEFVKRNILKYSERPALFAILGNTVSNLDVGESEFLSQVELMMNPEDYLMLDLSTLGPEWQPDRDRRTSYDGYCSSVREFLAAGMSRRLKRPIEEIISEFEQLLDISVSESLDVPQSQTITMSIKSSGQVIMKVTRYHWEEAITFLKSQGFEVEFQDHLSLGPDIGLGLVLVKRQFAARRQPRTARAVVSAIEEPNVAKNT